MVLQVVTPARLRDLQIGIETAKLDTHDGRRSVVSNLYASGDLDLADIAGFVGHSAVAATRGYIRTESGRPLLMSQKALEVLDRGTPSTDR